MRDYDTLTQIEEAIRGMYDVEGLASQAKRLMKEYFGWSFDDSVGIDSVLDMLIRQCVNCEKERLGAEIMHTMTDNKKD